MRTMTALLCVCLTACMTVNDQLDLEDAPAGWNGALYVGDPKAKAVVRAQSRSAIACDEPKFGEMICMSHADFKDLVTELQYLRRKAKGNP